MSTSESSQDALNELRQKIDEVDRQLVALVNQRAKLVVEVGGIKRTTGIPIYAPHREQQVLKKVVELSEGPLPDKTIEALYRELMSGSFHLEKPLSIGYVGPIGSDDHLAAVRHFGSSVNFEDLHSVKGVFTEVVQGRVDYGVVPIESTTSRNVAETMDAFREFHQQVNIYAEIQLRENLCLLAFSNIASEVKRIYGSHNSFAVCREWISTQYPQVELITTETTAAAAKSANDDFLAGNVGSTAIGNKMYTEITPLTVLFEQIQDKPNNITRFLVLSLQKTLPSSDDKTSMMFTTSDRAGALADVLQVLKSNGINLTHIDKIAASTPMLTNKRSNSDELQRTELSNKVNLQYTFFIDAKGHRDNPEFAGVIGEARAYCKEMTVLGSYPQSQRLL